MAPGKSDIGRDEHLAAFYIFAVTLRCAQQHAFQSFFLGGAVSKALSARIGLLYYEEHYASLRGRYGRDLGTTGF